MRKTDIFLFHLNHLINSTKDTDFGHHDTQFKIVDRFLSRNEEILQEENSLLNLLTILKEEIIRVREETAV